MLENFIFWFVIITSLILFRLIIGAAASNDNEFNDLNDE